MRAAAKAADVEIDAFLLKWLRENLDANRDQIVSDLAQKCREDALAAGYERDRVERRLGATIEEVIMVTIDGLRAGSRLPP